MRPLIFLQHFHTFGLVTHGWIGLPMLLIIRGSLPKQVKVEKNWQRPAKLRSWPLKWRCCDMVNTCSSLSALVLMSAKKKYDSIWPVTKPVPIIHHRLSGAFSALTPLVGRQEEHPACKNWVMRCQCGCLSGVKCSLFAYGPAAATAIPKPHDLLPHLNPDWFYLSDTGLARLSWKRGR